MTNHKFLFLFFFPLKICTISLYLLVAEFTQTSSLAGFFWTWLSISVNPFFATLVALLLPQRSLQPVDAAACTHLPIPASPLLSDSVLSDRPQSLLQHTQSLNSGLKWRSLSLPCLQSQCLFDDQQLTLRVSFPGQILTCFHLLYTDPLSKPSKHFLTVSVSWSCVSQHSALTPLEGSTLLWLTALTSFRTSLVHVSLP